MTEPHRMLGAISNKVISLRVLIPLLILLVVLLLLGFVFYLDMQRETELVYGEYQERQMDAAVHLQAGIERNMRVGLPERLQQSFSELSLEPSVRLALLTDEQDRVIASTRLSLIGVKLLEAARQFPLQDGLIKALSAEDIADMKIQQAVYRDRSAILLVAPVRIDTPGMELARNRIGRLFIYTDVTAPLAGHARYVQTQMQQLLIGFSSLALLIGLLLHWTVTRRVVRLLDAAEHAGEGRLSGRTGVDGPDEIGRLGAAFDAMMQKMVRSSAQIRKLSQAVEQSATSIIITDKDGVIEYVNPAFSRNTGYSQQDAIGNRTSMLQSGNTPKEEYRRMWEVLRQGGICRGEMHNRRKDGSLYWDHVTITPVRDAAGEITHFVSVQEDITKRKQVEQELLLNAHILNSINEGVAATDREHNICFVNPAFSAITGFSADEAMGKNPRLLQSGLMDDAFYREMWRCIGESGSWQGEIIDRRKNGESYPEWLSISTVRNASGEASHYVSVFSDISERKAAEAHIAHMAKHDFLTGLPNRMLLQDRLAQAIFRAKRDGRKVVLMFMDMDRFKNVNDMLGHVVGDKLLQEVSRRIGSASRASDTVCRLGGDEFVIMLPDLESVDDVAAIADKLLETVAGPCLIGGNELEVTTSIGISVFPEDGDNGDLLLQHADSAMYHAKEKGRNNYQFYTSEMNRRALERITIEKKLRRALERNEFLLHYQPQVNLQTRAIVGVEALLRWNDPETGMIPPLQFIPIAEENGLILPIGEWVLREACRQNSAWRQQGLRPITMAVNLSAVQFRQKDFGEMVLGILQQSSLDPSGLELEITESALMQDAKAAIQLLGRLKDMGVKLAMDDFGTGYSSLSYLKQLPIDKLKIDQSFVRDLTQDPDDASIVSTIISMAHNLKLKPVAEGVETEGQLEFLARHACDEGQGYYFSKPLPVGEATVFLQSHPIA